MAEILVLGWLARRAAVRPLAWLFASVLLLLPLWLALAGPFGGGGATALAARGYYAVAFIGGVAAADFALHGLGALREFGPRLGSGRRMRVEFVVLALFTTGAVVILLLPLVLIAPDALFSAKAQTPALAIAIAHVIAIAFFLNPLPLASGTRSLLLPLLAWVLPALIPGGAPGLSEVIGSLDAAALLRIGHAPPEVTAACASILAWVLAAVGLTTRRTEGS
jgi:hypothetical protein